MNILFSLATGAGVPVWEGDVSTKALPRTEAAAASFTAAGLAKRAARDIQATILSAPVLSAPVTPQARRFANEEVLAAAWVWSEKDEGVALSIVTRTETEGLRSYLGFVL